MPPSRPLPTPPLRPLPTLPPSSQARASVDPASTPSSIQPRDHAEMPSRRNPRWSTAGVQTPQFRSTGVQANFYDFVGVRPSPPPSSGPQFRSSEGGAWWATGASASSCVQPTADSRSGTERRPNVQAGTHGRDRERGPERPSEDSRTAATSTRRGTSRTRATVETTTDEDAPQIHRPQAQATAEGTANRPIPARPRPQPRATDEDVPPKHRPQARATSNTASDQVDDAEITTDDEFFEQFMQQYPVRFATPVATVIPPTPCAPSPNVATTPSATSRPEAHSPNNSSSPPTSPDTGESFSSDVAHAYWLLICPIEAQRLRQERRINAIRDALNRSGKKRAENQPGAVAHSSTSANGGASSQRTAIPAAAPPIRFDRQPMRRANSNDRISVASASSTAVSSSLPESPPAVISPGSQAVPLPGATSSLNASRVPTFPEPPQSSLFIFVDRSQIRPRGFSPTSSPAIPTSPPATPTSPASSASPSSSTPLSPAPYPSFQDGSSNSPPTSQSSGLSSSGTTAS